MTTNSRCWMLTTAVAAALVTSLAARATPLTLHVGDPAPGFELTTWLKNPPVQRFEPGHIYLLEFWATRCAPCIEALPHLKQLSQQYQGKVTFIAIDEPYDWETLDSVRKFVRKKDALMTYPVAMDALEGHGEKLYDHWGPPAGFAGFPVTFIVDGAGRIAWTGTPNGVDEPLQKIVAGSWDLAAARRQQQTEHDTVMSEQDEREAFRGLLTRKDYAATIKRADDLVARDPKQEGITFGYKLKALSATHPEAALTYAEDLPKQYRGAAAELLADEPHLSKPAYDFIARQLESELAENPNAHPMTWQTLAQVQHQRGNLDRAIEAQKTALAKFDAMGYGQGGAEGMQQIRQELSSTLDAYLAEKSKKR
jgi:thiol-disulfide isomerase/thioredoxin